MEGFPENIEEVVMYSSVDMNKFLNKELISYTPLIGFKYNNSCDGILSQQGLLKVKKEDLFIEYSSPCPLTCGK
jgi:hypothetical protein